MTRSLSPSSPRRAEDWAVVADWLVERGDPRGELLALDQGIGEARDPDERQRLERAAASLRPRLERETSASLAKALGVSAKKLGELVCGRWRAGLLLAARPSSRLAGSEDELLVRVRALLDSSAALLLGELDLGDLPPTLARALLLEGPLRSSLHTLIFGNYRSSVGQVAAIVERLPNLRSLHLRGPGIDLRGAFERVPGFEVLRLHCEPDSLAPGAQTNFSELVRELLGHTHPNLRSLHLRLGGDAYAACNDPEALLGSLLIGSLTPALEHLGLSGCEFADRLIPLLASSPLLARLRTLEISGSWLTDKGANELVGSAHAFNRLERLELAECHIGELAEQALVERFGERLHVGRQERKQSWDPGQRTWRPTHG